MVGAEVTELIQGFVIAMQLEATEEDLMRTVFPHPTLSEMMGESALAAYGRALHIPPAGKPPVETIRGDAMDIDTRALLIFAFIGIVAGFIASLLLGGGGGLLRYLLTGIIGAFVGGYLFES